MVVCVVTVQCVVLRYGGVCGDCAVCSAQVWCSPGGEGVQHMAGQGGMGVAGDGARGELEK